MDLGKKTPHIISILKGISWRIVATLDTIFITLLITCFVGQCSIENALKIGVFEFIFKLLLFYIHDRIWLTILHSKVISSKEVLLKSLSWRFCASGLTYIISGIIFESFIGIAMILVIIEIFTKFILFYIHERFWIKFEL
tara:strand:+ start:149 stop:568 length:420 start_codon:yes stop_codon:yes gene_type:complete